MVETVQGTGPVSWSSVDRVFVVRLARPPANAIGQPVIDGLNAALDVFDAGTDRVLVLVSDMAGFFAAGADITQMSGASAEDFAAYGHALRGSMQRLADHDRPSIAAIESKALGGGLELAMAASLRVGGRDAQLGLPEVRLGLIPGAGGTQRLPRLVGRGRALDIMLSARSVGAAEAHDIGLLDRIVDAGEAEKAAIAWAHELCAMSGPALTAVLRCVDDAFDVPLSDGLAREADRITTLFGGPEVTEGLAAFLERRPPRYS
jgi:Enoyl-CoA hydratase/carnithine racemase